MPTLFVVLIVLVVRSLTLPGAMAGVDWYILKFSLADINAKVVVAALGQAIFSLSLGGTFMVVYGSYLNAKDRLGEQCGVDHDRRHRVGTPGGAGDHPGHHRARHGTVVRDRR